MSEPLIPLIMLVEDNPGHVELTRIAFAEAGLQHALIVAQDGDVALQILADRVTADQQLPDILLLDLNLPGTDGQKVLEQMRKDPALCAVPVIVVTSSHADADIRTSYELMADAYVNKPLTQDGVNTILEHLSRG